MGTDHEMAFTQFLALRHKNFQRIACKTGGEYTTDDIKGEAWIMAHHIQDTKGISIDFSDKQFQELLLASYISVLSGTQNGTCDSLKGWTIMTNSQEIQKHK